MHPRVKERTAADGRTSCEGGRWHSCEASTGRADWTEAHSGTRTAALRVREKGRRGRGRLCGRASGEASGGGVQSLQQTSTLLPSKIFAHQATHGFSPLD